MEKKHIADKLYLQKNHICIILMLRKTDYDKEDAKYELKIKQYTQKHKLKQIIYENLKKEYKNNNKFLNVPVQYGFEKIFGDKNPEGGAIYIYYGEKERNQAVESYKYCLNMIKQELKNYNE